MPPAEIQLNVGSLSGLVFIRVDTECLPPPIDIPLADLQNIASRLTKAPYFTQEVVYEGGGGPTSAQYVPLGRSYFNTIDINQLTQYNYDR